MLNIKISIPSFSDKINIAQFVGNTQNIGFGCKFYINDPTLQEADYWFVIDDLRLQEETVCINKEKVYFVSAEVVYEKGYFMVVTEKEYVVVNDVIASPFAYSHELGLILYLPYKYLYAILPQLMRTDGFTSFHYSLSTSLLPCSLGSVKHCGSS